MGTTPLSCENNMRVHPGSRVRSPKGSESEILLTGISGSRNHRSPKQLKKDLADLANHGLFKGKGLRR
jgi:hypothetical protein